ncbi:hypothetical protein V6Z12_A07G180700 [Gossypium hirsutum]
MDIEPLWALGGWFFLYFFDCMAAPKSTSSLSHAYEKPHFFLLFLTLVFLVFLLLLNPSSNPINSSNVTPSIPFKRLLLRNSWKSSSSTMNLPPKQRRHPRTSASSFGAEAHEVPSGPNPISNSRDSNLHDS